MAGAAYRLRQWQAPSEEQRQRGGPEKSKEFVISSRLFLLFIFGRRLLLLLFRRRFFLFRHVLEDNRFLVDDVFPEGVSDLLRGHRLDLAELRVHARGITINHRSLAECTSFSIRGLELQ